MASLTDTIYQYCPVWLQNIGITAFGMAWRRRRFGGRFKALVKEFCARDHYTPEQWRDYQTFALRMLLRRCLDQVPYYRDSSVLGLTHKDVDAFRLEDLKRLPVLEKESLRAAPRLYLASNAPRKLHAYSTSGSTGTPIVIRMSTATQQKWSAAYEARCRLWAGVNHTMSRAMIGGRMVVPRAVSRPPFWRYNAAERQLYFSAFHIAPAAVPHYVAALVKYRPDYLVGYASSHFFLARMIEEQGLKPPPLRCVLTSSEKLTPEMRATISRVYQCPVFDGYSGVEACCLASECEHHSLHVSPDVGIVEILNKRWEAAQPGEEGEIVATGLLNFDQPLLRYRTGDLAVWSDAPCPCGRAMPVIKELVGRLEDTVIGPDGREMVRFHGLVIGIPGVREGQFIQESLTDFTVRVVAPQGLSPVGETTIRDRVRARLGSVRVTIEQVDAIERTPRGKFKAVISKISAEERRRIRTEHAPC